LYFNYYTTLHTASKMELVYEYLVHFLSGTDPIPLLLLILLFLFLWATVFKKILRLRCFKFDRDEIWQECPSSKFAHWRSRILDLTSHFQDGDDDVISRRKVLPSGVCTRSLRHVQPASNSVYNSWSIVHSCYGSGTISLDIAESYAWQSTVTFGVYM